MMLSSELRVGDRHRRVLLVQEQRGDPGPTYMEHMAAHVDRTLELYQARQYEEANELQKALANWVARMGDDRDFEPASARYEGAQLIRHWKLVWKLAQDVTKSQQVIEGNAQVISDKERLLSLA